MVRFIQIILILAGISCVCIFPKPAAADNQVLTDVKIIHASTASDHIDPGLKGIISELRSVFKYTSYRLIKEQSLNQGFNKEGRISLPGNRTLTVMPSNMENKRIRYQINISKDNQSVFQTQVLLKNNSSITIGGPQFDKGVLLFNISGSAR